MKTTLLRWSLSVALGAPAAALAVGSHRVPLIALGIAEAAGAVLLLPRRTRIVGAALLVSSLSSASVLHALSGELPPLSFLVYVAAIAVVAERVKSAARLPDRSPAVTRDQVEANQSEPAQG